MGISDWSSDVCSSDLGSMESDDFSRGGPSLFVVMAISLVLTMLVPQALSVLAAYDAKLGRRFDLGRYLSAGLRPIVPLLVCWLVEIGRASCRERVCQYV